jgi:hypothetical protein
MSSPCGTRKVDEEWVVLFLFPETKWSGEDRNLWFRGGGVNKEDCFASCLRKNCKQKVTKLPHEIKSNSIKHIVIVVV